MNPLPPFQLVSVGMRNAGAFNQSGAMITLVAGGADIWAKRDAFAYVCNLTGGDFDFRMQVLSIQPRLDNFTRVGLMAREAVTSAGSRHVMVAVNAEDSFQVVMRSVENALSDSVPHDPLPKAYGSNSWVRLQRVGAIFHAYTSSNGVDWTQLYQTTGGDKPFSDPIYFGIAAASHATNAVATNLVSHFGPTPTVSVTMALALALWEYRNAHDEAAMTWCRRLLVYPECRPVESALARIIWALAAGHAGQAELARPQLEIARLAVEKRIPANIDAGNAADGFWSEWLFVQALFQEAERAGE